MAVIIDGIDLDSLRSNKRQIVQLFETNPGSAMWCGRRRKCTATTLTCVILLIPPWFATDYNV